MADNTNTTSTTPSGETASRRREPRYSCLFPGMLRVLFPERSFVPLNMAVRVMNLSSGGAMAELHHVAHDEDLESFRGCFFELRIAVMGTPLIYGRVARTDMRDGSSTLGLMFHKPYPELTGSLIHGEAAESGAKVMLPMPVLNPFSPITDQPQLAISGRALEALEVLVEGAGGKETRVPVKEGQFRASLQLEEDGENLFRLTAIKGDYVSQALPVAVTFAPRPEESFVVRFAAPTDGDGDQHELTFEYLGPGEAGALLMSPLSDLLLETRRVKITVRAQSEALYDEKHVQKLEREAQQLRTSSKWNS